MSQETARFTEVQPLRANWLGLLAGLLVLAGCIGIGFSAWTATGIQLGSVLLSLLLGGVAFLLLQGELRTEVRGSVLHVRFFPLTRWHRFHASQIQSAKARTYRPIRDYGGWGVRWGPGGKAYNVSGNRGVQLLLEDGSRLLIGSQRAEELELAIRASLGEAG